MSTEIDNKVPAELRTQFGKGYARRARAAGTIPAVMYGHGTDPVHITVPAHQVSLLLRKSNALLDLQIEGKSQLVLVKDVQKDPVKQIIEHLDLVVVRKGEKVNVEIPVHIVGQSFTGTVAEVESHTVHVEAEATHIPEFIEIDIEGAHEGAHFYVKDLTPITGVTVTSDPELLLVAIHLPQKASDDLVAEEAEVKAEAAAEATSGEPADAE